MTCNGIIMPGKRSRVSVGVDRGGAVRGTKGHLCGALSEAKEGAG